MPANNINDIIPPSRRKKVASESVPVTDTYSSKKQKRRGGNPFLAIFGLIIVAGIAAIGIAFVFAGAKLIVHPNSQEVIVTTTITATPTPVAGAVPFEVVTLEKVASSEVPADGTETVSEKARGTLTVTNETSNPQNWVAQTRFESPGGLIYRVQSSVTIPANGTIDVEVVADQPGAQYNIGLADFTVPGLAGSPQFESIYATAKTPLTGGFEGERPVVTGGSISDVRGALNDDLTEELRASIVNEMPATGVLLKGATTITFEEAPNGEASREGYALIRQKGTVTALVLNEEALASQIAQDTIGSYNGETVMFAPEFNLSIENAPTVSELNGAEELELAVSGDGTIVWVVDPATLANAIAGKNREDARGVLANIPSVARAELVLRPFWKSVFPEDAEEIEVTVVNAR